MVNEEVGGTLLPLAQLAPGEGAFDLPDWPGLQVLRLKKAAPRSGRYLYVLLEGELLIDLPGGSYLHLRPGDAAQTISEHTLSPINEAVVLEWKPSS